MRKIESQIQIIGLGLAVLYAISVVVLLNFVQLPEYHAKLNGYLILFFLLFVASLAIVFASEWGRKVLILLNGLMFIGLFSKYIPQIDLVPRAYFLLSFIVLLYFSQDKVVLQFLTAKRGKWKSILVVDDDETLLKIIRPILMNNGYAVLTANTGEEGLVIAKSHQPELIILDVILPGIKGREVCKRLKADAETSHIPVIFLTSKDSPDDIQAELAVGAIKHFTKPFKPKALIDTIKAVLE